METTTETRVEHTAGRLERHGHNLSTILPSGYPRRIAQTYSVARGSPGIEPDVPASEGDANARRIAAAWNACENLSTDELERGIVADLLAALRECVTDDGAACHRSSQGYRKRLDAISALARAAIARTTGKGG